MRKLAKLLPLLAILALIAVAAFVLLRTGPITEHVRKGVQTELGRQFGRPVSVRKAELTVTGGVVLHDVVIANKDGSALLKAPLVEARVGGVRSLVRGDTKGVQVRSIHLTRPELSLARSADGAWSVSDLLERTGQGASRFRAGVSAEDARITFVDGTRGGLTTTIENADLSFRQPSDGQAEFRVRAEANEGRFDSLDLRGERDTSTKLTELAGSASRLNVPFALERIPGLTGITAAAGTADVKGKLTFGGEDDKRQLDYDVGAEVSEAEVSFPWLRRPVKGIAGKLKIEGGELRFDSLKGTVENAPIELNGEITDLPHPEFGLDLLVTGIRYPQLRALFPRAALPLGLLLPSPMRVTARVEGPVDQIKVSGEARVKVIKFHAIPWHDLVGKFEYQDGRLKISNLKAHGSPRQFEAELEINLRNGPKVSGSVALANMPLAMLAEMAGVKGEFGGLVRANVRGASANGGELRGDFTVERATVQGVELGRLAGEFTYGNGNVKLRRVRVIGPTADGMLDADISPSGSYALKAQLVSLDLSKLGPMVKLQGLRGHCCAQVQATGQVKAGQATAFLRLGPGELQGKPFDSLTAEVVMTRERISARKLDLRSSVGRATGELSVIGWRSAPERSKLSGRLVLAGMALEELAPRRYAALAVRGVVAAEAELSGSRAKPVVSADVRGESVSLVGRPFAAAKGRIRYQGGHLYAEQLDLRSEDGSIVLTGGYAPETGLAMKLEGAGLDLGLIAAQVGGRDGRLPPSTTAGMLVASFGVEGTLDVHGDLTGSLERPQVSFRARAAPVKVNGALLDEVTAVGRVAAGALYLDSSAIGWGKSRITVAGEIAAKGAAIGLSVGFGEVELGDLLLIADSAVWRLYQAGGSLPPPFLEKYLNLPRPLNGRLTGTVLCSGSFAEPRFDAPALTLSDVGFDGGRIEHIEGKRLAAAFGSDGRRPISLQEARIELNASHQLSEASVMGELTRDGRVSLDVETGNLDLQVLSPWLNLPVGLGGEAQISLALTGDMAQPKLSGTVFVDKLRLGTFELEAASAGPITLKNGSSGGNVLNVEDIRLRKGEMEAVGEATIPLNGVAATLFSKARLQVWDATFAPVRGMLPAEFDADLYLEGTTLYLRDGGSEVATRGIHGKLGDGEFSITGKVQLGRLVEGRWQPAPDIALELRHAQVSIPKVLDVHVDGTVALRNDSQGRPTLTTRDTDTADHRPLVASDGTVSLEQTQFAKSNLGGVFAPQVDVRVAAGADLWFQRGSEQRPTRMLISSFRLAEDGSPSGYLDITEKMTGAEVVLEGEFASREGQLAFPNGVLALRSGTAWIARKPREKPVVTVSAEAEGWVGDYLVSLQPVGQLYPYDTAGGEMGRSGLTLNLSSLPPLQEQYVMALLQGPVAAPTRGGRPDLGTLLADPTRANGGGGEITGIRLPTFGDALGMQELSLDVALQGAVRLRLGQRIAKRLVISYVSTLSGPVESRTLRFNYEVTPRYSIGYGVNELDQGRWEANAFVPF